MIVLLRDVQTYLSVELVVCALYIDLGLPLSTTRGYAPGLNSRLGNSDSKQIRRVEIAARGFVAGHPGGRPVSFWFDSHMRPYFFTGVFSRSLFPLCPVLQQLIMYATG